MATEAKAGTCAEKRRITDAILYAVRELQALHDREIEDLVRGGTGLDRIELALELARRRRDEAKARYLVHVRAHRC